jgi:glycosyltransferase involved in cell wall biosynthesis
VLKEKNVNLVQVSASLQPKLGGPCAVVIGTFPYFATHYNCKLLVFGSTTFNSEHTEINSTFLNNRFGFRFKIPNRISRISMKNADVLMIHGYYLWSTLLAFYYSKCQDIYLMPHGSLEQYQDKNGKFRKNIFNKIAKHLLKKRTLHFLLGSDAEISSVRDKFANSKISVVGLGVDYNINDCLLSGLHNPINLLCLSRISPEKRIDLCIRAMVILNLSDRKYQLNIYGSGDVALEAELRSLVKSLDLEDVIHFKGHVDGFEKVLAIKNSDIMLLPSENENFALAVAESIAFGKPVVVSKFVAMHEFVDTNSTGLTIDELDVNELVFAIKEISNEFSTYQENCTTSAHLLAWEQVIKRWFHVIDNSLSVKK